MTLLPDRGTLVLPFRECAPEGVAPLRVGVVHDGSQPSPWVDALLSFLGQIPGIDVRPFTLTSRPQVSAKRPSWLMDWLYTASRARFDPLGAIRFERAEFAPESAAAIREAGCGVLIWLAACKDSNVDLGGLARHGAFTLRLGERGRPVAFWDEVTGNSVTSEATIYWHESSLARGRIVRKVETSSFQGLFFTWNAEEPLIGAIRVLAGLSLEIRQRSRQFTEGLRAFPETLIEDFPPGDGPTSLEAGRFVLRNLARNAHRRWTARGKDAKWFVAMRPNSGASIADPAKLDLKGFQEVPLPQGVAEMADPFVWEAEGRRYLFFEELAAGASRGRLGVVELFGDGSCSQMTIILARPYHLSYPCVAPAGGELFLLPESLGAGSVDIYRFSRFPEEVELIARPVEGLTLVDTTPVFVNDRWYFFTTTAPPFMESLLFWSDRLDGAWHLHPCSPVSCSVRNSRSAGHLFWRDGRLYRPTQDCSVRYGYGIQVNEVVRLTPDEFEERTVNWIPPTWSPGLIGTHTWNESDQLQVIDGLRWVLRDRVAPPCERSSI